MIKEWDDRNHPNPSGIDSAALSTHSHRYIYIVKVEEVMMYIWIEFYLQAEANLVAARHQVSCSLDSFV